MDFLELGSQPLVEEGPELQDYALDLFIEQVDVFGQDYVEIHHKGIVVQEVATKGVKDFTKTCASLQQIEFTIESLLSLHVSFQFQLQFFLEVQHVRLNAFFKQNPIKLGIFLDRLGSQLHS